ncbi:MAG: type II secretion system F family protein [Gemmatimonadota bacterium]
MSTGLLFASLGAALGTAGLIIGLFVWFNRRKLEEERQLRERLGDLATGAVGRGNDVSILRQNATSNSLLDKYLSNKGVLSGIEQDAKASGLNWTAGEFASFVLAGLTVGIISFFFLDWTVAIAIGLVGAVLPFVVVANMKAKRLRKIEEQLPDAVDMLVNSLRAGYSLQAGMNFVGTELPAPLGPEFSRFYDEQRLGIDVRQALNGLTERLGTLDARMFVLAIIIQRETGGNLSEILGNIASVIRERINFRQQLDVMTAESKLSALVLTMLPIVMYFVVRASNPEYLQPLTTTDTGKLLLLYGFVSLGVGYVFLRKMSTIEV